MTRSNWNTALECQAVKKTLNEIKTLTRRRYFWLWSGVPPPAPPPALSARWLPVRELPHVSGLPQGTRAEYFTPEVALFPGSGTRETQLRRVCTREAGRGWEPAAAATHTPDPGASATFSEGGAEAAEPPARISRPRWLPPLQTQFEKHVYTEKLMTRCVSKFSHVHFQTLPFCVSGLCILDLSLRQRPPVCLFDILFVFCRE